jgi:choline kinase
MPILTEPRDGTKDRVQHGDTGFYCVDSDGFKYALKMLERKEKYRYEMARNAKDWARQNLDPRKWVDMLNELLVPIMDRNQV